MNNKEEETQSGTVFKTTDIVLAATLKVLGFSMTGIDLIGNKGTFKFSDTTIEVLTAFDLGTLKVEPVAFNSAIKALTTATRRAI